MTADGSFDPVGLADWATDEIVRLGPLTLRIVSDVKNFPALRYFSRAVRTPVDPVASYVAGGSDVELWCISGSEPPPGLELDRTARARGFRSGYYVTDHFGPPLSVATVGRRLVVFGPDLENVVWPYFVKVMLLHHTVDTHGLFLKAAAVAVGDAATLIVGRGGAGKTVFLSELCRRGTGFITNSHAITRGADVQGVASAMRMRPGPWVDRLGLCPSPALDPSEVVVDPLDAFGELPTGPFEVRNVVIVDYHGPDEHRVEELSEREVLGVMEQFCLGLNVYRLEEDLLDRESGDYCAFSSTYDEMKARLRNLVRRCRRYYVATDVQNPANQDRLLDILSR